MLGGLTRQGRLKARGGSGWRTLALGLLGVYMCLAACANAAVMGLDYGTDWFTIALANPGRPLDLVLNRDANRQTASVVTVNGLERTFGSNAIAIAPRMPEVTFMAVRNLLGVTYDSEAATLFRKQFPNKMVRTAEDTVAFEVANATLTVPEIVAMQLQHAKQLVAESEGVEVRDAVLTVPSFFDRAQRQAMLDAAELAGLRTAALVNDGSAVALSYAMNCAFEAPERHVFYDMGASKTVATVSGFYARKGAVKTKAKAKAKKPLVISTHAFAADSTLGGQEVDFIMRDLLAAKFAASGGDAVDLAGSARAMTRLLREAKRVKTILSVNAEATASVEGLINGIDFRTPITRVELERATAHLLPRIRAPIDIALAEANLTIADIDSIVLVGGGSRVPFVQRALSDAFGADKLSRTVNAEEACVMGAVFKGATLSSLFRVRDMRLRDALPYAVRATYAAESTSLLGGTRQEMVLVLPDFGAVGARRTIRNVRSSDFAVEFEARPSGSTDASWTSLASAKIGGVGGAAAKLKTKGAASTKPEVRVVVHTNELGAFEIVKAEALFNVTNPAYAAYAEDVAAWEAESAAAESTSDDAVLRARPTVQPETVTEIVTLELDVEYRGAEPMSNSAMQQARDLLQRMDDSDAARIARHGAANQLESLVYHLRDIAEDDDVVAVTTPAQRDALDAALTAASEWLEDNAEHAQTAAIEAQIATLRTLEAPITFRKAQHAARPDRIDTLRTTIAQAENFTALIRAQYSSAEIDSAAEVLEALEDSLDSTLSWLDAMVIKQDALAPSDDPVLTVEDIDAKAQAIERGLAKLIAENIKKAQESAAAEPSVDEHADSVKDDESASSPAEPEPSYTESDSDPRDAGHDEL
ncbi:lumenal Hsp70 protein [Coemansia sp. RSA 1822]|nr:lumenal Hsp70 protein [Coemansia sp. RSA 638]KAJ2565564.1 lumenal Hsp70 protein [Coemansia sp. RSA 1822]